MTRAAARLVPAVVAVAGCAAPTRPSATRCARTSTRWQLIMFRPRLGCAEVRAAAPKFPAVVCG